MSATCTEILPARKSSKHSAIRWTPVAGDTQVAGVLVVDTARASAAYTVSEFVTGWAGRGFLFAKLTPGTDVIEESYSVFCGARATGDRCECKGWTFAGHCKHVDAARGLLANGWL